MTQDSLLVFASVERLMPLLPSIVGAAGIRVAPRTIRWVDNGIEAESTPRALSWWGDRLATRLHRDANRTTAVEFISTHNGIAGWLDLDNVWKLRGSFKRVMKSLGVTVALVRPRLN